MWFKYNINGITIQLQITEYQKTDPQNWDDFWCHIVLYLESPPWLSFHMEDECLLSCEIDNLIHYLTLFCNHQLSETTTIECVEPNFSFVLCERAHGKLEYFFLVRQRNHHRQSSVAGIT